MPSRKGRWSMGAALALSIAAVIVGFLAFRPGQVDHMPTEPAARDAGSATPGAATQEKTAKTVDSPTPQPDAEKPESREKDASKDTRPAVSSAKKEANSEAFRVLKGRWLRPDGDYMLEVRSIDGEGKAEVGYFNPNPIHVSEAKATREDSKIKFFIELRDSRYPGCTYNLNYDSQNGLLRGVYYQAAMGQEYEVVFQRLP
jgi:hypothetical protein